MAFNHFQVADKFIALISNCNDASARTKKKKKQHKSHYVNSMQNASTKTNFHGKLISLMWFIEQFHSNHYSHAIKTLMNARDFIHPLFTHPSIQL